MKIEKIYEMGSKYQLKPEECSFMELEKHIHLLETYGDEGPDDEIKNFLDEKDPKDGLIFFQKNGYIGQIKENLNLDLNKYLLSKNVDNQREIYKILYLVYALKKEYGNKVLQIFKNPTMAVVDYHEFNQQSYGTKLVSGIKSELEKELTAEFTNYINEVLHSIVEAAEYFENEFSKRIDRCLDYGMSPNMEAAAEVLDFRDSILMENPIIEESFSPIQALYWRVAQSEYIGRYNDIIRINSISNDAHNNYNVPESMIPEYKLLNNTFITYIGIEDQIEREVNFLAKYVYRKQEVSKSEKEKILYHKNKIRKIVKHITFPYTRIIYEGMDNKLFLVACFQAILLDQRNEKFDYSFFGYRKDLKKIPKVQAIFKEKSVPPEILRKYWHRKVSDHYYANLGRYEQQCTKRKIEEACDKSILRIISSSTPDVVNKLGRIYVGYLCCALRDITDELDDVILNRRQNAREEEQRFTKNCCDEDSEERLAHLLELESDNYPDSRHM